MKIESIDLQNFRNYETLHLDFSSGVTIFYGDNAQGKTNLLEAIYLALTGKSYRNAKDREMISFQSDEAHVKANLIREEIPFRVDVHLKKGRNKGIAVNFVPVRKMKEYAGKFGAVVFSPEDLEIVKDGPDVRRRFMDNELSMTDPVYFDAAVSYKKALEQRNQLLKDASGNESLLETLPAWTETLAKYGKTLIRLRREFIREIEMIVKTTHENLTGKKESLTVAYEPNTEEERLEKALKDAEKRDIKAKTTTVGPHRDDIGFTIQSGTEPIDLRIYGSQGQQRTAALSLKLSEIEFLKKKTGENPILLLDDVFSELDSTRQQLLVDNMQALQTFITCTGLEDFVGRQTMLGNVFRITNGVAENG